MKNRQSGPPPNKKQALSERKAAFFPKKTYVLTTGNLQSDDRKPTIRQQKACFLPPQKPLPCPFPPPVSSFHARSLSAKTAHLHLSVYETKKTDNRMTIRPSGYPSPEAPFIGFPSIHIYKGEKGVIHSPSTRYECSDKPLLTINNPNGGLGMKKKEKLNLHDIPTYKTISYFCIAFGKQTQLG